MDDGMNTADCCFITGRAVCYTMEAIIIRTERSMELYLVD